MSADMTPAERSQRARVAVHTSWARTSDPSARTAPARAAFLDRFEREVDPDGILEPAERTRRAEHAKKAHFARLALASAKARRKKAEARREVNVTPDAHRPLPVGEAGATAHDGGSEVRRVAS